MDDGSRGQRHWWRFAVVIATCIAAVVAVVAVDRTRGPVRPAPPAATPPRPARPAAKPPAAWLGLDYNSGAGVGRLRDFARRGVVYDREGSLEVGAGDTPANSSRLAEGLDASYAAHMVPDIVVNSTVGRLGCDGNPNPRKLCLPTGEPQIESYVRAFVRTARSVVRAHRGKQVLFEPMNEPWDWASPPGTGSGAAAASEYAAVLAQVLPAAKASGVPLSDIYVPATGTLSDGSSWVSGLYGSQPCLKPGPASCGPIAGWNVHPYGLPGSSTEGILSVPAVRAAMLSGQDNVVISEIGFCATDVNDGQACDENKADIVGTSSQTAAWLSQTLKEAAPMHRAGWLKALLLWERGGSGFAIQNPDGRLTAQGRVLDLFADSSAGR